MLRIDMVWRNTAEWLPDLKYQQQDEKKKISWRFCPFLYIVKVLKGENVCIFSFPSPKTLIPLILNAVESHAVRIALVQFAMSGVKADGLSMKDLKQS